MRSQIARSLLAALLFLGSFTLAQNDSHNSGGTHNPGTLANIAQHKLRAENPTKSIFETPRPIPVPSRKLTGNPIKYDVFTYDDNDCQYVLGQRVRPVADRDPVPCYSFPAGFDSYFYNIYQGNERGDWEVPNALHGNCDWRDGCGNQRTDIFMTRHGICKISVYPNTQCKGLPIHVHDRSNWKLNEHKCINKFFRDPTTKKRVRAHSMNVWCDHMEELLQDKVHYPWVLNMCPAGPAEVYDIRHHEFFEHPYFYPDTGYEPATKSCQKESSTSSSSASPAMTTISTVLILPVESLNTISSTTSMTFAPNSTASQSTSSAAIWTRTSTVWVQPTTSAGAIKTRTSIVWVPPTTTS